MVVCHEEAVGQHHQGWGTVAATSMYSVFCRVVLRALGSKAESIDY